MGRLGNGSKPSKHFNHYLVGDGKLFYAELGGERDHGYILTKFNAMKKKYNEDVSEFIKRFNKLYNIIPIEIKPPQVVAKVVFFGYF